MIRRWLFEEIDLPALKTGDCCLQQRGQPMECLMTDTCGTPGASNLRGRSNTFSTVFETLSLTRFDCRARTGWYPHCQAPIDSVGKGTVASHVEPTCVVHWRSVHALVHESPTGEGIRESVRWTSKIFTCSWQPILLSEHGLDCVTSDRCASSAWLRLPSSGKSG